MTEPVVDLYAPGVRGYALLKKRYVAHTVLVRHLANIRGKTIYRVKYKKAFIGTSVPNLILQHVFHRHIPPQGDQRSTNKYKDAIRETFKQQILSVFPLIPERDLETTLYYSLKPHRVGRNRHISIERKATLAVIAQIRHHRTNYDWLLNSGKRYTRAQARRAVRSKVKTMLAEWQGLRAKPAVISAETQKQAIEALMASYTVTRDSTIEESDTTGVHLPKEPEARAPMARNHQRSTPLRTWQRRARARERRLKNQVNKKAKLTAKLEKKRAELLARLHEIPIYHQPL